MNITRKDDARPEFFQKFVCRSVYCLCVNVYCTAATGWQPNCSLTNMSYHIILAASSRPCNAEARLQSQASHC